jgi:spore coat polysaccharide biosynthesis protein SpsF
MRRDLRISAIVQARMGSTRLPGKVLMYLGGKTALARVVTRLRRATLINEVVVATSDLPSDDRIARECEYLGVRYFRGSECDVLDRYYRAAKEFDADAVVRITSDCPIIDPQLVDETIHAFQQHEADYASNVIPRTYPRGLDTEVFTTEALAWAWLEAREPHQREHVTPYFYEHPEIFKVASAAAEADYGGYRWTLDTPEDLELLRTIYSRFDDRDDFSWRDVVTLMEREPDLAALNSHIAQKAVLAG